MLSISKIIALKNQRKITMITAYDAPSARIAEDAGIDTILVGDSIANAVLGFKDTLPVEMEEMLLHSIAVRKGAPNTFIIGDMPFLSYQISESLAIENAGKFLKYAGMDAVKLEGGTNIASTVKKLVDFGIPVMGHIGFTPQSYHQIGIKSKGKNDSEKNKLIEDAKALEEAGAFGIVLEMVNSDLAKEISEIISIPTIGIGSGVNCDGQVLVWHDLLGLNPDFIPKFAKKYADGYTYFKNAIESYIKDVNETQFPGIEHSFVKEDKK